MFFNKGLNIISPLLLWLKIKSLSVHFIHKLLSIGISDIFYFVVISNSYKVLTSPKYRWETTSFFLSH